MDVYLQTDLIQLQAKGGKKAPEPRTISAQDLIEVLGSKESVISYRISYSAPLPPDRDDYYHEYPYRKPCDRSKGQKCDQLIRVVLKNDKSKAKLELFYTLIEGRTEISALRIGLRQIIENLSFPVRVGEICPRTSFRLRTSKVDIKKQSVSDVRDMRATASEKLDIYDSLEVIAAKILKEQK